MLTQAIPRGLQVRVQNAIEALDSARAARDHDPDNPLAAEALDAAISEALNAQTVLSEWVDS